jgi:dimethylargininase
VVPSALGRRSRRPPGQRGWIRDPTHPRPPPVAAPGRRRLTHLARVPVDPELALRQWEGYVAAFRSRGWAVSEVEPADEHPDGVFVEDTVVVFPDSGGAGLAVLTRPGVASRQGEVASTARALDGLVPDGPGLDVARIVDPGTLDGGDVLKVGRTAYVGRGGRTNEAAIAQLAALVRPRGWEVVPVPVTAAPNLQALHLKSAVTALPDGTVVGRAPVDPFDEFLVVPEDHGTAVVDLGGGAVVMSADAPRTAALYRSRGLDVLPLPITEFEKLEGCVTCLSVRLRA